MTTATTQINITAKDSTAGAFASAESNLSSLAGSAIKTAASLAGIGLSITGAIEGIKSVAQATIQFQQFTNTLQVGTGSAKNAADALAFVRSEAQRLGLDLASSADQFAKLTAASKGTALEGKATRDIFSAVAQASTAMGLSADQTAGSLLAIQQMISKGTVSAEELRGQLGERLPGAFQIAARAIGVTTAELDKMLRAGQLTADQLLPALSAELNKTFGAQAEQAAQGLTAQMNRMNTALFDLKIAIGESGLINFLSSGIELATNLTNSLAGLFGGGKQQSPIEKQISLIKTMEEELESMKNLTHVPLIGDLLFDKKQADLLKFRIETATEDLQKMKAELANDSGSENTVIATATKQAETLTKTARKTISESERFLSSLKKEAQTVGLTAVEMKRLEAAHLGVSKTADPLINRIEQVTSEMDAQKAAAASLAADLKKIESITESVKTKEEKLADTQTELNRLMDSGLSVETYNRALKKAQDETRDVVSVTRVGTDDISQLWVQAGRNIQNTLSNSIFDFFSGNLDNMVSNVKNTALRIVSEFTTLKIAQISGLSSMFSVNTGAGVASAVGQSAISAGASQAGSSLFGSGSSGMKTGGIMAAGSMGGIYGIAIAAAVVAANYMNKKYGDYRLGGTLGSIDRGMDYMRMGTGGYWIGKALGLRPLESLLMNALFGHAPYKFRQQVALGNATDEGFSGRVTDVFRSKGGLLVGNRHQELSALNEGQILKLFDSTITGFIKSAKGFAENLGLNKDVILGYNQEIRVESEKGKALTDEQLQVALSNINDDFTRLILPNIDQLSKYGETAAQALIRLNTEFTTLSDAATLLGNSVANVKEFMSGTTFDGRTAFVDAAGGLDALAQKAQFFAENFLTAAERLAPQQEKLNDELTKLGLSASITREQFGDLVKSFGHANGISEDMLQSLLSLAPAFINVRNAQDQLKGATDGLVESERSLADIRSELLSSYGRERNELESTIDRFKNVASTLRNFKNSLALSELSPLTPGQRLEEARAQFNRTRALAAQGDQSALEALPSISQEFLQASQTYNASSAAFISDFNLVKNTLDKAADSALSQSEIAQGQLDKLQSTVEYLTGIDDKVKTTNEILKELLVATLKSGGNSAISTKDIQNFLASNPNMSAGEIANAAIKFGVSQSQLVAAGISSSAINQYTGGGTVTDKQILDFVNANRNNPMAIYNAARANGISSDRLASVTGISEAEIDKFVRDNKLQSFAKGTDFVAKSGLAMVHRAEAIVPSSTTEEIKKLREELAKLRQEQNQQTGDLIKVTDISNRQNAKLISDALAQIENRKQWADRSKARLA